MDFGRVMVSEENGHNETDHSTSTKHPEEEDHKGKSGLEVTKRRWGLQGSIRNDENVLELDNLAGC